MGWICGGLTTLLALCLIDMARQRAINARLRWRQVEQWNQFLATRRRWLTEYRLDVSNVTDTLPDELDDWRDLDCPRPFRGPPA